MGSNDECEVLETATNSKFTLHCPICDNDISVGLGGEANLEQHQRSDACSRTARHKKDAKKSAIFFDDLRIVKMWMGFL